MIQRLHRDVLLWKGDCLAFLPQLPADSIDACVTDPPYGLSFMGKNWDHGVPGVPFWSAILRVLKPGAHLVAFGGTRTYHRMACAIEDAGFEIRDSLMWLYGQGFPKSHDVSKGIDRELGAEREKVAPRSVIGHQRSIGNVRPYMLDPNHQTDSDVPATDAARQWDGWGTALKPAFEPIIFARKPLSEPTIAANVLKWGTGALNIGACRIEGVKDIPASPRRAPQNAAYGDLSKDPGTGSGWDPNVGRWPANVLHDGSKEVVAAFPQSKGQQGEVRGTEPSETGQNGIYGRYRRVAAAPLRGDSGSAARFFWSPKASKADRAGSKHPTVKPVKLMAYLGRLITPPGGTVLDPFAGSGTTGAACIAEGFRAVLCEQDDKYQVDICKRMEAPVA